MAQKLIRVTQVASPIGRPAWQRANLIGLGLNKLWRSKLMPDTPAVRGRLRRVHHLVRVEPADGATEARPRTRVRARSAPHE